MRRLRWRPKRRLAICRRELGRGVLTRFHLKRLSQEQLQRWLTPSLDVILGLVPRIC